ncbi:MAG TPA: helix-turn-helix transcriptional regulator [Streptosporangiaceae bacterium]
MPPSSPTVHRRQLGAELRRLREAAGLRVEDAAATLGCSPSRVSRIEIGHGKGVAKPADVRTLCELYKVTDERQVDMLLNMLSLVAQHRGWWEDFGSVLPSGLEVYVGLESDARAERCWEPLLVHGLLQTADYARAVFQMDGRRPLADVDDLVQIRTERQKLLHREGSPLEVWAIFDEAVLRRPIGGVNVMHDQLRHLVEVTQMPNVAIQIVPLSMGANPGLGGSFSILEFEEDSPVVYVDSRAGNLYLEKRADVRQHSTTFDLLRSMALAPAESVSLLERAAEEMT